jgi:hypothetical protein
LPVWRPFVPEDTVYVCVFREPQKTAHSILKECQDAEYLRTLPMDFSKATTVLTMMYSHVLEIHRYIGNWLFVHYDQVLNGSAIPKLEATLGVHIDRQLLDPGLKRSQGDGRIGLDTLNIYNRLCELAEYPDNR